MTHGPRELTDMVVLLLALTTHISVSSLPQQAPDMQQGSDP